jgi:Protein of unknown function (DUF1173)
MHVLREAVAPAERQAAYLIGGRQFDSGSPLFTPAIAAAHAAHQRPRCRCVAEGVEMYVARWADGYLVKRMPGTGSRHAPDCPSWEPPPGASGLGQVLGSAISEDPATGTTTLKLDFALSKIAGRSMMPSASSNGDSVTSTGTRLSLRGLLHYLWDQAELTRWQHAFAGKRNWSTVRKHLLQAAENKIARGDALLSRLYIPESFIVDQRDAINARRLAQWSHLMPIAGRPQPLMLLIAEVKEIVPARYGFKAVVKHVPDQAFVIDEPLYRRLERRFTGELSLWGAADQLHMVMIATFQVGQSGIPAVTALSLMPVTAQWLPVEDAFEKQLVEKLVADGRSFTKGLRYNLPPSQPLATATLADCAAPPPMLFIAPRAGHRGDAIAALSALVGSEHAPGWMWHPGVEAMPPLPCAQRRRAS